jgi:hypothetical protein
MRKKGQCEQGASLLELMLTVSLGVIVTGMVVPLLTSGVSDARASSAAYFLTGRVRLARMESVKRGRIVGLRFERSEGTFRFAIYEDGNGNGLRNADIAAGIDRRIIDAERVEDRFPGVRLGIAEGIPAVEPGDSLEGGDPVRLGRSDILSFTPSGTATPGTLYVLGAGKQQHAVRVLGATGRTRTLTFNPVERRWIQR